MSPEERAARSARIRELLAHSEVQAAFAQIDADLINEWKNSRETNERENCWHALQIMERLKTWLNSNASSDLTALRKAK